MSGSQEKISINSEIVEEKKVQKMRGKKAVKNAAAVEGRGVVYVKHIPHGFFEPQISQYFKQFGEVTRMRLSRSKKSGRSKGYAFVEFDSAAVAQIAAKAMEDYLMFRHRLMCTYVEPSVLHPDVFKGANRKFRKPKGVSLSRDRHNRPQTAELANSSIMKIKRRTFKKVNCFKACGIDYELPSVIN